METRQQRRRGGKSAHAVSSDPPVRPPSKASEGTAESGEESDTELADIGATGVRDRGPPTTTQPGDAYQTPPAGAGAGTEGSQAEAPPSPVSLAQGGLTTIGDDLSGPDVEGVDMAEATATAGGAGAQDPSGGPPGPQAMELPSHTRVEQADTIETTGTDTLEQPEAQTHTQVQVASRVETQSLTLASRAEPPSLT